LCGYCVLLSFFFLFAGTSYLDSISELLVMLPCVIGEPIARLLARGTLLLVAVIHTAATQAFFTHSQGRTGTRHTLEIKIIHVWGGRSSTTFVRVVRRREAPITDATIRFESF